MAPLLLIDHLNEQGSILLQEDFVCTFDLLLSPLECSKASYTFHD